MFLSGLLLREYQQENSLLRTALLVLGQLRGRMCTEGSGFNLPSQSTQIQWDHHAPVQDTNKKDQGLKRCRARSGRKWRILCHSPMQWVGAVIPAHPCFHQPGKGQWASVSRVRKLKFIIIVCMCMCCMCVCVWCTHLCHGVHGGQRTALGSQFSSTFTWARLPGL